MLKKIAPELYAVEEAMPCGPQDFHWWAYLFPGTFGKAEAEEAAARLVAFSREQDRWVGASWEAFLQQIEEEVQFEAEQWKARESYAEANLALLDRWQKTTPYWKRFFQRPPASPPLVLPSSRVEFSTVPIMGTNGVSNGLHQLIEQGYVKRVTLDGTEDRRAGNNIMVPTRAMVKRILEVQRRKA